jgi:UDP-glucuronate decarboxylase
MEVARILVAGGAGFIGQHLCERLIGQGHKVLCLDNFSTSDPGNVAHLLMHPNFDLLQHDITLPLFPKVDKIYNLACPASPVHYQIDPVQTIKSNVLGVINMLELAKRLDVPILQASTSEVYGDPLIHPQSEEYWGNVNPIGPRSCYNEGKRCAEALFFAYRLQHRVNIKIARIFNTYGPKMRRDDGRVVSNFIDHALRAEPLPLHGGGTQTRSFCYVDDLVTALVLLMEMPPHVTGPVNLGHTEERSIRALAELVVELSGSTSPIVEGSRPQDDPQRRRPDISRAHDLLGWAPSTPLREGLLRTIAYFESTMGNRPLS